MCSCLALMFLYLFSCVGFFIAVCYLIMLIFHVVSPKTNIKEIVPPDENPSKAQRIKWLLIILISTCWVIFILLSIGNTWYQEGIFFDLSCIVKILIFILAEISFIYGVKKWNTLKWSGLIPFVIALGLWIHSTNYLYDVAHEEYPLLNKMVDSRFKHDYPYYMQLVHQAEMKNITDWTLIYEDYDIPYAPHVYAWKNDKGVLQIRIGTGGYGFAGNTHHWGYLYVADDKLDLNAHILERTKTRKMMPCWYRFVD
jgi:hypothetical protein